jgi:hypothetical protein
VTAPHTQPNTLAHHDKLAAAGDVERVPVESHLHSCPSRQLRAFPACQLLPLAQQACGCCCCRSSQLCCDSHCCLSAQPGLAQVRDQARLWCSRQVAKRYHGVADTLALALALLLLLLLLLLLWVLLWVVWVLVVCCSSITSSSSSSRRQLWFILCPLGCAC